MNLISKIYLTLFFLRLTICWSKFSGSITYWKRILRYGLLSLPSIPIESLLSKIEWFVLEIRLSASERAKYSFSSLDFEALFKISNPRLRSLLNTHRQAARSNSLAASSLIFNKIKFRQRKWFFKFNHLKKKHTLKLSLPSYSSHKFHKYTA